MMLLHSFEYPIRRRRLLDTFIRKIRYLETLRRKKKERKEKEKKKGKKKKREEGSKFFPHRHENIRHDP